MMGKEPLHVWTFSFLATTLALQVFSPFTDLGVDTVSASTNTATVYGLGTYLNYLTTPSGGVISFQRKEANVGGVISDAFCIEFEKPTPISSLTFTRDANVNSYYADIMTHNVSGISGDVEYYAKQVAVHYLYEDNNLIK